MCRFAGRAIEPASAGRVARAARRGRIETSDRGETLVEVLVAVAILGVAGVAVMAGLMMSVRASDMHRKETTGSAYVKSFAEAIQDYVATPGAPHYKPCAGADAYKVGAVTSALSLPAGYTATQDAAQGVGPTGAITTPCSDVGIQQVTLHVRSSDGRADESLTIVLRNPCDPSVSACTT